jgi:hypothetical protein
MRRYVQPTDPQACALMQKLMRFEEKDADGVTVRVEAQAMDLNACATRADDGSCAEPRWLPDWVEHVRKIQAPGFGEAFYTRFGWHLVYVMQIRPDRAVDNPQTQAWLREQVHLQWQREAFADYIARLSERRAVRIANASEQTP